MACSGKCETRLYRFDATLDGTTVIARSAGAPELTDAERRKIFSDYFEVLVTHKCKECANGCECVLDPGLGALEGKTVTQRLVVALPEPIEAMAGADTYTMSGKVLMWAAFYKGVCTDPFDPSDQHATPPPDRVTLKTKKFKPKAGTADCQCRCERQVYEFRPRHGTTVTPKTGAQPLDSNEGRRNYFISELLKTEFGKGIYADTTVEDCNKGCTCLLHISPEIAAAWKPVKIPAPVTVQVTTGATTSSYEIAGEYDVRACVYKGVCTPAALELETG